jgi:very-short-patch-repair endonuclease
MSIGIGRPTMSLAIAFSPDMGVATVRVRNRDVLDDCRAVLERLQHVCAARAMTRFGRTS